MGETTHTEYYRGRIAVLSGAARATLEAAGWEDHHIVAHIRPGMEAWEERLLEAYEKLHSALAELKAQTMSETTTDVLYEELRDIARGVVDRLGYLWCTECAGIYGKAGYPVFRDSVPHNTEPCEGCGEPLTIDTE